MTTPRQPSRAETQFAASADPDATFLRQMQALLARAEPAPRRRRDWRAEPLRPLLLGYSGKGNVGADIRVREMLRQLRTIFAHAGFAPRLVTMGQVALDPLLDALPQLRFDGYFPDFIGPALAGLDGVIACEGSMFTSKFSDILSATFAGAIGLAARQGQLAVGYGAESGRMSERLSRFVAQACDRGLVLARSRTTHEHLRTLGVPSHLGADTAWTFEPGDAGLREARARLREHGWDGAQPVAVVCPMNPFCWPIRVDFDKAREHAEDGRHAGLHYDGVLFHTTSADSEAAFANYLQALRTTIAHLRHRGAFVVLVGMEKLDGRTCAHLGAVLDSPAPAFVSGELPAAAIVALLHSAHCVVTSRFHAAVLSLNAGVRTIGIALDERIRNLYTENGLQRWFVHCSAEDLAGRLVAAVDAIADTQLQPAYDALVARQLRQMGAMGLRLHDEVVRVYPDFPPAPLPRRWRAFLPPLSPRLQALLDAEESRTGLLQTVAG